ncbi:MAG: hypothetical protein PHG90_01720 [Clostridia bacterium]|jgi:hypothetical protein|nr:hypothetical protein [Clostridia bacterium]
MIFKIKKQIFDMKSDYSVKNALGETVCKVAVLTKGYYIYNKTGIQLAQLTFEGNTASLAIAKSKPSYPGAIKMRLNSPNNFKFSTNEIEKDDERFISAVKGGKTPEFSIWGKPKDYNFDIYEGSSLYANVIPVVDDSSYYQVRTSDDANFLYVLLICFANEKLHFDPASKF